MKQLLQNGERLVVVRSDRVGDVIISSSCFPVLKQAFPKGELHFAAPSVMKPLFCAHDHLTSFIEVPKGESWWEQVKAWRAMWRKIKPDAVAFLHPDSAGQMAAWLERIKVRVGIKQRGWNWSLTLAVDEVRRQGLKHEAAYNFEVLQPLGVGCPKQLAASLSLAPSVVERATKKLAGVKGRFAVLNPTAHSLSARWAPERFVELGRWLQRMKGLSLVVIGAEEGDRSVREIMASFSAFGIEALNLSGQTALDELAEILRRAEGLITRDTGPSHLAAAVGCPVVVIFGRSTPLYGPVRWRPLGTRVKVVTSEVTPRSGESGDEYGKRAFAAVTLAQVMAATEELIFSSPNPL
jgi:ADP-heptose:LPS heptosyltransferase